MAIEYYITRTIGGLSLRGCIVMVTLSDASNMPSNMVYCIILEVTFGSLALLKYLQKQHMIWYIVIIIIIIPNGL